MMEAKYSLLPHICDKGFVIKLDLQQNKTDKSYEPTYWPVSAYANYQH